MLSGDIIIYLFTLAIFLISLSVHEYAHARMAYKFGDDTAMLMGRLTLNPVAHISLFGTIILPLLIGFGWAKPVPVNFSILNKRQIFIVSAAGPLSNLSLALVLTLAFHILPLKAVPFLAIFILLAILYNFVLAVFNLIPIPPLDGSKMVYACLKSPAAINVYNKISQFGLPILIGLMIFARYAKVGSLIGHVVSALFSLLRLPRLI
jgi:Zn-dependent protease